MPTVITRMQNNLHTWLGGITLTSYIENIFCSMNIWNGTNSCTWYSCHDIFKYFFFNQFHGDMEFNIFLDREVGCWDTYTNKCDIIVKYIMHHMKLWRYRCVFLCTYKYCMYCTCTVLWCAVLHHLYKYTALQLEVTVLCSNFRTYLMNDQKLLTLE